MAGTYQTFAKSDLPKETRVVKEGGAMTMDYRPDRYAQAARPVQGSGSRGSKWRNADTERC